ncbi:ankyrin repeat-containing domain protein [Xylariaceae sp. AK1471]|nr:ankyrin repeat-containing domain protein [Xylariaceae sp. AK1471]
MSVTFVELASFKYSDSTHRSRAHDLPVEENRNAEGSRAVPDTDPNRRLFLAIKNHDVELVKNLVENGASVDATDGDFKETPLHRAAMNADVNIVRYLLDAGVPVDARSAPEDKTPLICALCSCLTSDEDATSENSEGPNDIAPLEERAPKPYAEIVKILVEAGASVYATSRYDSVLTCAARQKNLDIVRCVVEHSRDKSFVNTFYEWVRPDASALAAAVGAGNLDIVRYLVEAGADPLLRLDNNRYCTCTFAIHKAFQRKPNELHP